MTGRDDHALVDGEPAIDDAATDLGPDRRLIDLRIPAPALLAGARIDGEHDAPVGDAEDRAVRDERRGLLPAAARSDVVGPGEAKSLTFVVLMSASGL